MINAMNSNNTKNRYNAMPNTKNNIYRIYNNKNVQSKTNVLSRAKTHDISKQHNHNTNKHTLYKVLSDNYDAGYKIGDKYQNITQSPETNMDCDKILNTETIFIYFEGDKQNIIPNSEVKDINCETTLLGSNSKVLQNSNKHKDEFIENAINYDKGLEIKKSRSANTNLVDNKIEEYSAHKGPEDSKMLHDSLYNNNKDIIGKSK